MLQLNIGFTLQHVLAAFTHSAIAPPNVNSFGWNLEHSWVCCRGWPWQILGVIRAVATAGEPGEILFLSGKQHTISPITCWPDFTKFEHKMSINVAMKTFRTKFIKFTVRSRFFHLMNGLNSFDKTDWEYSLVPIDDVIRFWRSEVKAIAGCQGQILRTL